MSLRTKIVIILSTLLLCVVFAYLILADRVFREDKELVVFDTNKYNAERVANELDSSFKRVIDKMEILSQLVATPEASPTNYKESGRHALADSVFEQDPDLLAFELVSSKSKKPFRELFAETKLKALGLDKNIAQSPSIFPIPNEKASTIQIENRSTDKVPIYLIRVPIKSSGITNLYAQALVDGTNILSYFQGSQSLSRTFAVALDGTVFAHPELTYVLSHKDMSVYETIRKAKQQSFALNQSEFESDNKNYIGVYRKTTIGPLVIVSVTEKAMALAAGRLLLEKTVILSAIIITVVFLISLFFAGSISTPLLRLVKATHEIARGNFDTEIHVEAQDEIGVLAQGFSNMARELKTSHLLLEEYNRKLELKVQERTQELESKNVAIRQQQEVLLRTTRLAAVGEIAGQAAHEVLNPLTAMISRVEAMTHRLSQLAENSSSPVPIFETISGAWKRELKSGGLAAWEKVINQPSKVFPGKTIAEEDIENLILISDELKKYSQQLKDDFGLLLSEAHRISRIVDGMRGLSRAAKIKRRIDACQLINDCVKVSEDLLKRYQIKIETHFESQPLYVVLEADEIKQVFSNLIKNSMDAIEEKRKVSGTAEPGLIKIRLLTEKNHVKIFFRDNGLGIKSEDFNRVFDANFSTKGGDGTGFGLSICRRFVRECGGEMIIAESELGKFTEFEISFPLLVQRERATTHAT